MLIGFEVQNFRSFNSQQNFSLVASNYEKNVSENVIKYSLPGLSGVEFLSSAAVYGANASGKSNLFLALLTLRDFVVNSFKVDLTSPTCAEPFKLRQSCLKKPSKFEIQFMADVRYHYTLSLTAGQVVEESLEAYPKGLPQKWFVRKWNQQKKQYNWEFPNAKSKKGLSDISERTRCNVAFLSKAADDGHPHLQSVCQWFVKNLRFLDFADGLFSPRHSIDQLRIPKKREQILALLQAADLDIDSVEVEEKVLSEEDMKKHLPPRFLDFIKSKPAQKEFKSISVAFSHTSEGGSVKMDYKNEESNGTKRFFSMLGSWLDVLENGYTVLVDELETCLHPKLVIEIIKLFSSKLNTKGAQLIFTTHNPLLLDETLLRRDQIWFTDTEQGATRLYPLSDYSPRKGEALVKGYMNGRYGGIPFIPDGLIPHEQKEKTTR
jgi:AAA15 family ATPase/GTPase